MRGHRYAEVLKLARNRTAIVLPAFETEVEDAPLQAITGTQPLVTTVIMPRCPLPDPDVTSRMLLAIPKRLMGVQHIC